MQILDISEHMGVQTSYSTYDDIASCQNMKDQELKEEHLTPSSNHDTGSSRCA
jgi:hypothetical protein